MRTIKFRGKRVNRNNEWSYGDLRQINGECFVFPQTYDAACDRDKVYPDTVGQFTGYFDNNGNEIYEGDVIKVLHSFTLSFGAKHNRKIRGAYDEEWSKTDWGEDAVTYFRNYRIELGKRGSWIGRNGSVQHPLRNLFGFLIGNIHDNPELMKKND